MTLAGGPQVVDSGHLDSVSRYSPLRFHLIRQEMGLFFVGASCPGLAFLFRFSIFVSNKLSYLKYFRTLHFPALDRDFSQASQTECIGLACVSLLPLLKPDPHDPVGALYLVAVQCDPLALQSRIHRTQGNVSVVGMQTAGIGPAVPGLHHHQVVVR